MFFKNPEGQDLFCKYFQKSQSKEIYILCHRNGSSIDCSIYPLLGKNLSVNIFGFDFPGHGKSQGTYNYAGFLQQAKDLQSAYLFLKAQGFQVKGVIAHSKAANVAIIHNAAFGTIPNVIAVAPRYFMGEFPALFLPKYRKIARKGKAKVQTAKGKETVTMDMLKERMSVDMKCYCQKCSGNLFIVHGREDDNCPVTDAHMFVQALGSHLMQLHIVTGDDSFENNTDNLVEALEEIFTCINECI